MDFLSIIKNVAPFIAGTFGTPLAGIAVKALVDVIPDANKPAAQDAAAKGPESFLQHIGDLFSQGVISTADIKKAEMSHSEKMAELGYKSMTDLAKIDADDRDSARKREIATKDETPKIIASVVVISWVFIQWHLINNSIPHDMREIIMRVLGTLDAALVMVLNYYFGSSASSKAKDDTLAAIAKQ